MEQTPRELGNRSGVVAGFAAGIALLVGSAGPAAASATIDLLWNGTTSTLTLPSSASSSFVTLDVLLTAGPQGVGGYSITILYDPAKLVVTGFNQTSGTGNPHFGQKLAAPPVDDGSSLQSFNGVAVAVLNQGAGLSSGNSTSLGTVTFHKLAALGTFHVDAGIVNVLDAVSSIAGFDITATTVFHGAQLVVPEPAPSALLAIALLTLALARRPPR